MVEKVRSRDNEQKGRRELRLFVFLCVEDESGLSLCEMTAYMIAETAFRYGHRFPNVNESEII